MNVTLEREKPSQSPRLGRMGRYIVPAGIAVLAVVAEVFGEAARSLLRYDRDGLADGESWRLVSGHIVHLGPSHMVMNVAALAVLALIFGNSMRSRDWLAAAVLSSLAIGGGLYWLSPAVGWYVGLSGVLHGFWAAACVRALAHGERDGLIFTSLILIKLGYETLIGPVPLTGAVAAGPVVEVAHAYGAAGGAVSALAMLAVEAARRRL